MFREWLSRLRGERNQHGRGFQPLYSLEEIAACGQLPILSVLALAGEGKRTANGEIGPGVGAILSSLLRRNLIFTRQVSVIGGEDSGYLNFGDGIEDDQLLQSQPALAGIVAGQLQQSGGSELLLRIRALTRGGQLGHNAKFTVRVAKEKLPAAMPAIAAAVCKRMGIAVEPAIAERWRHHNIIDWNNLVSAAQCWEGEDSQSLAELLRNGKVHPDAIVAINADGPRRTVAHWALSRANELEPDNPQLAFSAFCALCNFADRSLIPPRFELMLRAGLAAAPGHGKSHMVLPHTVAMVPKNNPYILAHSETGYRLLPGNSFALSNFSTYLMNLAPRDERILPLFTEAIERDGENPAGYQNAISFFLQQKQLARAVPFAEALLRLCTPPISERTLYCFRQSPSIAKEIDDGKFVPQLYAVTLLNRCRVAAMMSSS